MNQKTLSKEVSWSGIGLHTGEPCTVKVGPADSNFGIKFKRTDVSSDSWIPADVRYVSSTKRCTSLRSGDCEIKTVEHLLGALYAVGITNAKVEVDGPELPILDGSGAPFSSGLLDAGLEESDVECKVFELQEIVEYQDDSGAEYLAIPSNSLLLDVLIDFGSKTVGHPHAAFNGDGNLIDSCAGARTFVYSEDVLDLADAGLIKGGHIDNAVVIRSQDVGDNELKLALEKLGKSDIDAIMKGINKGFELKYDNELARHKMFDLIGDLALIGAPIKAKIWAKKPGHTGNVAFAQKLKSLYAKQLKLKGKPLYDPDTEPLFTTTDIMGYLPHRYPMLMVDKIIELSETHVVGVKNLTFNEQLFQGHFPNNPVFPGVLQMEALAQTGGILALNNVEHPSNWDTYFLKMDNVKFKRKVVPGDTLILKMELLSPIRRGIVHMQGTAYVGNHIVSEGELTAQIVDRTTLK